MDTSTCITTTREAPGDSQATRLLLFNDEVLAQGEALARACEGGRAVAYGATIGPHLRHVIEHYEALVLRPFAGEVDYDQRMRDRALERSPMLARQRFAALRAALRGWIDADLQDALLVFTFGGVQGQWPLACASTIGRELVFLASHAVHHYALLREPCKQEGIAVAPHFGIAPATAAHAIKTH